MSACRTRDGVDAGLVDSCRHRGSRSGNLAFPVHPRGPLRSLRVVFFWRFLVEFAVKAARQAVLNDERMFRKWFSELRLSIFVKSTGEYVWNDAEQQARE